MNPVVRYFEGERFQCTIGILIALVSLGLGLYYFTPVKTDFYKGIGYPFVIVSCILLAICIGVVLRTSKDIERVSNYVRYHPEKIKTEEIPRMEKVQQNFRNIKLAEIIIALLGLCFFVFVIGKPMLRGIGLGLLVQAIILYLFDHIAESRGRIYLDYLQNL